jgi:hypothetical protein
LGCSDGRLIKPNALVDAYANGWIVDRCMSPHTDFSPDRKFRAALAAVLALWLMAFAAALQPPRRREAQA